MKKNSEKRDKIIDGIILALKVVGSNGLFFGIFLIAEGLSLIIARQFFPIFIALSIMIAFAFAIEWFVDILRGKRTVKSVLQQICITLIIVALLIYCALIIFDDHFRLSIDRVIVCATTIADGIKNLIRTAKVKKHRVTRIIFIILSLVCINYGIVYLMIGGAEINIFTTTMHGVAFIFCGLTNIWLFMCGRQTEKINHDNTQTPATSE